ncbi:hypothetical protein IPA_09240 [Ignicoccus pacificus DSM 13166]|uniref:OBG-type G domain-containing protein n=1 Tax=Ignicoccus pacificus DSM 13166 TaxID=940294 RepID=A0A977KCR0_9CREN|nr:hypothetical protein IPA_09240 [Ignicoccus pacificus DSM 13166]
MKGQGVKAMKGGVIKDPPNYFRHVHVPTADEIVNKVLKRYPKLKPKGNRPRDKLNLELERLNLVYQIILDKLKFLDEMPKPERLHPFYLELASLTVPYQKYWASVLGLIRLREKMREMWEDYRALLRAAVSLEDAARIRREAVGRALSMVRRSRGALQTIRDFKYAVASLPSIDFTQPRIVVAGMPSSGKSSFVKKVSTADVEVASYPFTTREVHVGHIDIGDFKVQVVDTPGILDRPWDKLNEIERKAAAAIRYLPSVLLFLYDVSPESYGIEDQTEVLDNVLKVVPKDKIVIALNKMDVAEEGKVKLAKEKAEELGLPVFEISVKTGKGLKELLEYLIKRSVESLAEEGAETSG